VVAGTAPGPGKEKFSAEPEDFLGAVIQDRFNILR